MRTRGFSLLEMMIALAVMLIGSVGALVGIMSADLSLREGQLRLHKQVLVDASLQRARLYNKELLYNSATTIAASSGMPDQHIPPTDFGTGSWTSDPTTVVSGDLSTGALFIALPDGSITPCTTSTAPSCSAVTKCNDSSIPLGVFCREVVTTRTAAAWTPGSIVSSGAFVTTKWVRVFQKKKLVDDTMASVVLGREVFAQ